MDHRDPANNALHIDIGTEDDEKAILKESLIASSEKEEHRPIKILWLFPRSLYYGFMAYAIPLLIFLSLLIAFCIILESTIDKRSCYATDAVYLFKYSVSEERAAVPAFDRFGKLVRQDQYDIRLDAHAHTKYSDGWMTPKQLLDWALASDYNAIFVTDHNNWRGAQATYEIAATDPAYKDKICVIPGLEFTCCRIHMNLVLPSVDQIPLLTDRLTGCQIPGACGFPSDDDFQAIIAATHSAGGKVIVNHWPWSHKMEGNRPDAPQTLPHHPSQEDLLRWGVDGFEIVNGSELDFPTMLSHAASRNVTFVTGSDVHIPFSAYSWTLLKAPFSSSDILDALFSSFSNDGAPIEDPVAFQFYPQGTKYPNLSATFGLPLLRPFFSFGSLLKYTLFINVAQGMYSYSRSPSFCHPAIVKVYYINILLFIFSILSWIIISFLIFYYLFLRRYLANR
jgi:PHP domain